MLTHKRWVLIACDKFLNELLDLCSHVYCYNAITTITRICSVIIQDKCVYIAIIPVKNNNEVSSASSRVAVRLDETGFTHSLLMHKMIIMNTDGIISRIQSSSHTIAIQR